MIITGGTGQNYSAGVSSDNRLLVQADSHDAILTAAVSGRAFRFCTGLIALTSALPSAVMFLKNLEPQDLVISELVVRMNQSTGGANGVGLWEVLRNPSAGTIVNAAVPLATRLNTNFGNTAGFLADAFKGAEAATFTDGAVYATVNGLTVPQRIFLIETSGIILPRGTAIGVRYTPPVGNTSITITCEIGAYLSLF